MLSAESSAGEATLLFPLKPELTFPLPLRPAPLFEPSLKPTACERGAAAPGPTIAPIVLPAAMPRPTAFPENMYAGFLRSRSMLAIVRAKMRFSERRCLTAHFIFCVSNEYMLRSRSSASSSSTLFGYPASASSQAWISACATASSFALDTNSPKSTSASRRSALAQQKRKNSISSFGYRSWYNGKRSVVFSPAERSVSTLRSYNRWSSAPATGTSPSETLISTASNGLRSTTKPYSKRSSALLFCPYVTYTCSV
mmetsp:Transcript_15659/g.42193  ORF Transcript_15659/g.42193 Transcript_15659/m.42193 type:complete len:255 (+) Transcript_15659:999-1763(+)